jgi:hypothetical protein
MEKIGTSINPIFTIDGKKIGTSINPIFIPIFTIDGCPNLHHQLMDVPIFTINGCPNLHN